MSRTRKKDNMWELFIMVCFSEIFRTLWANGKLFTTTIQSDYTYTAYGLLTGLFGSAAYKDL